ncbi:hypothetical protein VagYM19_30310 [Vibrio alginolyticus]|uniref:hypothetical protein n=1 Tax=Vibrio diabolicus TaxID=50719 RepID=UPI001435E0FF|nr:hypothetical protein [Vibrio diabolicus]ELK9269911.1 hypothetical protein [Vibrio alginolyticus]BCB43901.1 hypothetical protein Vag1382_30280 [Vibrio alginolyticus]BCB48502.1 hypothetical protein VagVIO5_30280 [Vibrio alginolyticus]BCB53104.1 hypothetical protein VagYM19_30310 [Vibrio alginolyticus]BCB57707.1 hypothetical protein VagYM4_30300 [Vibrio alginolyticus]
MTKYDHVNIENMQKAVQALERAIDADIDEQVVQALESENVIDIGVIVDKNGNPGISNGLPFDVYTSKDDATLVAAALNEADAFLLSLIDNPTQLEDRSDYQVQQDTILALVNNFTNVDLENVPSLVVGNIQEAKQVLEDAIQRLL